MKVQINTFLIFWNNFYVEAWTEKFLNILSSSIYKCKVKQLLIKCKHMSMIIFANLHPTLSLLVLEHYLYKNLENLLHGVTSKNNL